MSRRTTRIAEASAFVLHSVPWRETSLIVKAFSREHGIVTLVAKGAKRPYYSNARLSADVGLVHERAATQAACD
jgi:recombinational DNA repair protein (RecF pathway)